MSDIFSKQSVFLNSPGIDGVSVTPSDTTELAASRAIYVGSGGDLTVQMLGYNNSNTSLTFSNVQDGTILPIRATKVKATGTTANNIIVLF